MQAGLLNDIVLQTVCGRVRSKLECRNGPRMGGRLFVHRKPDGSDEGCAGSSADGEWLDGFDNFFVEAHERRCTFDDVDRHRDSAPHYIVDIVGLELHCGGRVGGEDLG